MNSRKKGISRVLHAVGTGILIMICLLTLFPIVVMIFKSLRDFNTIDSFWNGFTNWNFLEAFRRSDYMRELINSLITTAGSVGAIVILSSMAAYPIARISSKVSNRLYFYIVAGLVVPAQIIILPILNIFQVLHIPSGRFTSMLLFITCSIPFATFLYVGFIRMISKEYEEAAFIDGVGVFKRFFKIVFPVLKPATIAIVITQGAWIWNDYFFQMVFTSHSDEYTLALGMLRFAGDKDSGYMMNPLFASCIISVAPIVVLYFMFQKQLMQVNIFGSSDI